MKEAHYTEAVLTLLREGKKITEVLKGLKKTLEDRGHTALLPRILRRIHRSFEEGGGEGDAVTAYVAREEDQKKFKREIAAFAGEASVAFHTDETLIGGYIARKEGAQVDASYKRQLVDVYRNIMSTS